MAMHVVSSVINQLSALILEEAKLLGGVGLEIQHIVDELGHMKAFLRFTEAKEDDDPRLEEWMVQVQDVAYDIQDIVDEFLLRFAHHHGHGFYGHVRKIFTSIKNLKARHRIALEIQGIKSRITNISESQKRYQYEYGTSNQVSAPVSVNNSWHDYRDEALLVEEAKLVGINEPKQQLISQLLDGDSELKVVSVLGMGGIGKTTLVKKVQEDANVKRRFQILAWATVSQTCDIKELLKGLIQQLYQQIKKPVPQQVAFMRNTDQLKAFVKDFLREKRYLIVFDDVWDVKFWDVIKFALPEGSCGNRVMLTTRIADVANASNVEFHSYVHKMQPLSTNDSWALFCKKTFKNNCCPAHLETVAKGILRKCKGLPLAIVTISGVLALKDKSKMDEWKIVECSLGGELEVSGKLDALQKILSLSYNELPYHLKTCLLYASIFPEDYKIKEARLIRFWIAEGFVLETTRMTKYEVGRAYLDELTNRSLIQQEKRFYGSTRSVYRIHDLLRELILSKSSRKNFATIAVREQRRWPKKVRRLAIHDFNGDTKESICHMYLRSLVAFKCKEEPLSKSLLSELLRSSCRLLKVLDLEGTQLEEIPEEVFWLFHLKVLNLRHTRVKIIPKSIGQLKKLEYLDLSFNNVGELPEEILRIEGLSHLVVYETDPGSDYAVNGFKAPNKIGKLLSLERLCWIEANEILIGEIGELKQLKRLAITSLRREDGKQLCASLGKLSKLEQLWLQAIKDHEVIDLKDMNISFCSSLQNLQMLSLRGRLKNVPQLISSLRGLISVQLLWSGLMDDPLESLQHLPNLQRIYLNQAYKGESLCFKAGCFLKLESLNLFRLHNLRWLKVEEGAMPILRLLDITALKSLEEFPWGVQYLTKLQRLQLALMSDKVIAELRNQDEESEDYQKISHIPEILIWSKDGWCRHPQYWKE